MEKNFQPLDYFKNEETVLNLLEEVMEFSLDPRDFEALTFDVRQAFGQYIVNIKREMYGERVQDSVDVQFTFSRPKTWWQHFKEEKFPKWLLRKFPVKYTTETQWQTVEFNRTFIFPKAHKHGHPILDKFIIHDFHDIVKKS